jgi:hypothetical protein
MEDNPVKRSHAFPWHVLLGYVLCLALAGYFLLACPYHIYVDEGFYLSQSYSVHFSDMGDYRRIFTIHSYFYPYVLGLFYYPAEFLNPTPLGLLNGVRAVSMALTVTIGFFGVYRLMERLMEGTGLLTAFLTLTSGYWVVYEIHVMKDLIGIGLVFWSVYFLLSSSRPGGGSLVALSSAVFCLGWFTTVSMAVFLPTFIVLLSSIKGHPLGMWRRMLVFGGVQLAGVAFIGLFDYAFLGGFWYSFISMYRFHVVDRIQDYYYARYIDRSLYLLLTVLDHKLLTLSAAAAGFFLLLRRDGVFWRVMSVFLPFLLSIQFLQPRVGFFLVVTPFIAFFSVVTLNHVRGRNVKAGWLLCALVVGFHLASLPPFNGLETMSFEAGNGFSELFFLNHPFNTLGQLGIPKGTEKSQYSCVEFASDFLSSGEARGFQEGENATVIAVPPCYLPVYALKPFRTVFIDTNVGLSQINSRLDYELAGADYVIVSSSSYNFFAKKSLFRQIASDGRFEEVEINKSGEDPYLRLHAFRKKIRK